MIDRTEAMTVVDVNTGKFVGSGGNLEETVTKNNLEAAEEIVRQLRLRDIGGIIVVDFIDMVLESNRDLVLRRLVECLSRDRTKHQVAEVTSLGLVQMTRKKLGLGLLETFSEACEVCAGRGIIVHHDPVTRHRTLDARQRGRAIGAAAAETVVAAVRRRRRAAAEERQRRHARASPRTPGTRWPRSRRAPCTTTTRCSQQESRLDRAPSRRRMPDDAGHGRDSGHPGEEVVPGFPQGEPADAEELSGQCSKRFRSRRRPDTDDPGVAPGRQRRQSRQCARRGD